MRLTHGGVEDSGPALKLGARGWWKRVVVRLGQATEVQCSAGLSLSPAHAPGNFKARG